MSCLGAGFICLVHDFALVLADEDHEDKRNSDNSNEGCECDIPACEVDQETDTSGGECCAEKVSEQSSETSCGSRNILRREVDGLQSDEHDWAVNECADQGDEHIEHPQWCRSG